MRPYLGILVGLGVGIAGTFLFMQSLPPEEGSTEERAEIAEEALRKAQARVAEFQAETGTTRGGPGRSFADQARSIGEDIRDGNPVDIDRVFQAVKPWLRDLAPIFDRIRVRDQKRLFDTKAGQLARKYELTQDQQRNLKIWLDHKAEENSRKFADVVNSESTRLKDIIRASRDLSRANQLDDFMEGTLRGDALVQYREDRMLERAESVQREADRKVARLDKIVELDEAQKDEIFVVMARGADEFDPSMQFEGLTGDVSSLVPGQSREEAIQSVLRPDQVEAYQQYRRDRFEKAQGELNQIGLTLPPDWDLLDESDF